MPNYRVVVRTGDLKNAGTDARIYLQLVGPLGEGRLCRLDNSADNFERGQTDTFDVQCESVGWVNEIGLTNDNSGEKAGWYVDDVTVSDKDSGLAFHADFNRWLAEREGLSARRKTNLGVVTLERGVLISEYIGATHKRVDNRTNLAGSRDLTFQCTTKSGFSLKDSTAQVVTTGAKVSASLFGIGAEFTIGVTSTALSELQTYVERMSVTTDHVGVEIQPQTSFTIIFLWFQDTLGGMATANNVSMRFEQRWEPQQGYDVLYREGVLSDQEVEREVRAYLVEILGENGEDPRSIPAVVPLDGAHIPVERHVMEGLVTERSVRNTRAAVRSRPRVRIPPVWPRRVLDTTGGLTVT